MAKPGVMPAYLIDTVLYYVKYLGEVSFLEIDTFGKALTKHRKTAIIQFSRCCSDNNLQLHTHIHEPAFIGAVGVNISVECQGYATVTKDGRQGFDMKALLG